MIENIYVLLINHYVFVIWFFVKTRRNKLT